MDSTSNIVMVAVAGCEALFLRSVARRLRSRSLAWLLLVTLLAAAGAAIGWIDLEVPLQNSRWRPASAPVPWWMALLAWGARCGGLFALLSLAPLALGSTPVSVSTQKSMK